MNYYLIDYENLTENGLKGIEFLSETDSVDIFYSRNQDKISFDMHLKLCNAKARISLHKVISGTKNALDFQLATYLGYLVSKNDGDCFNIISKDNGYKAVLNFWNNVKVNLAESIQKCIEPASNITEADSEGEVLSEQIMIPAESVIPTEEKKTVIKKTKKRPVKVKVQEESVVPAALRQQVEQLFSDNNVCENVCHFIVKYKTKSGVNNAIVKEYGTEKAGDIYKKIKPLIKDKKGN